MRAMRCVCDMQWGKCAASARVHVCTRARACERAINKPPSVPPTQLEWDGRHVPATTPHGPERLCLSLTNTRALPQMFLSPKMFCPLSSGCPQIPLPCFIGHTFQAELEPARTGSVTAPRSPEGLLSTALPSVGRSRAQRPWKQHSTEIWNWKKKKQKNICRHMAFATCAQP